MMHMKQDIGEKQGAVIHLLAISRVLLLIQ